MPKHDAVTVESVGHTIHNYQTSTPLVHIGTNNNNTHSFRMASVTFGNGGESEEQPPSVAKMHRREASSGRRYHVEVPACDDEDRYTPASRSKIHSSPRRTRSDLPRRSHPNRDEMLDAFDYVAPTRSSKQASMKSNNNRRHTIAGQGQGQY